MHQHLLDSTQQHLLLLMNDSVEKKKTIADLLTDSVGKKKTIADLLTDSVEKKKTIADLLTDSVEKKKTIDDLLTDSVEKKKTIDGLLTDSVEKKKTIDDLVTDSVEKKKSITDLLTDSVKKKKTIDKLSAANQLLNHELNKLKADFDLLKETVVGTSKDQILSDAKLGGIFKDMCQEDKFREILLKEFNDRLSKMSEIARKYDLKFLMNSISVEDKEQQLIAISKEMQVEKNNFIKNEIIVKYTQMVIDGIDDFVKIKVDSPSSCCKQTFEQLKSHIKTFHYFEHMNQVIKFHGNIDDMLNKRKKKKSCLYDEGCDYLRLEWKSFSPRPFSPQCTIEISVDLNPLIIYFTQQLKDVCLVNATGSTSNGKHSYDAPVIRGPVTPANQYYNSIGGPSLARHVNMAQPVLPSKHEYRWEQSYEELKELGFIVNDTFILKYKSH